MALEVKKNLNAVHHPATLVQMLVAYAKLSCPLNRDINRGLVASPGNKRHTRSNKWRSNQQVYEQLFVDVARFIVSKKLIKHLNTQSTVNGIFAVALAGMGHRIPSFLYKLLVKLRKEYPGALKFQEMDKQYKIATTVLGKTCNKQSRLICRELKRLRKVQLSNVKGAIATKDDTVKYYDAQRVTVSGKFNRNCKR
ncbi:uncharacterized protein BXIN_0947 [Babesia sp. Xinjiang]|uniref:uncharacterized protein n=1 Tax=Babesia sp. Xinjiang TaxID=462227 RepID=UPI000A247FAD|nr:uncharacterized protein BXIN_0947 [Babesia sp. Xinjiang]ORM42088.1 hypothetical protein BXIN_0947 [Babesia sp. Xinjiang]